jgi:hypothetical protein
MTSFVIDLIFIKKKKRPWFNVKHVPFKYYYSGSNPEGLIFTLKYNVISI